MANVKRNMGPSGSQSGCEPGEHRGWAILHRHSHMWPLSTWEWRGQLREARSQQPVTGHFHESTKQMLNSKGLAQNKECTVFHR